MNFQLFRLFCLIIGQIFFLNALYADVPIVLVSVAPHKFFVEKIAKNTVEVHMMVPAGASAHTYEPTPRQMVTASKADLWFRIGEPFENRAIQALKSHRPTLEVVDLRHGLDLISHDHHHGHGSCCPGAVDLHFWLSARQAQIQAQTIADALGKAFPGFANTYKTNMEAFQQELKDLDAKIQSILEPLRNRNILVSHPAYAYFCRDYDLKQYAIEVEGKDPTPQQMTKLLNTAKQLNIRSIFIQMQYNNKAAKLVADTLGAHLIVLDPYSERYFDSMLEIAHAFAEQ
jgi:zinc transport system substrate-binding protein